MSGDSLLEMWFAAGDAGDLDVSWTATVRGTVSPAALGHALAHRNAGRGGAGAGGTQWSCRARRSRPLRGSANCVRCGSRADTSGGRDSIAGLTGRTRVRR